MLRFSKVHFTKLGSILLFGRLGDPPVLEELFSRRPMLVVFRKALADEVFSIFRNELPDVSHEVEFARLDEAEELGLALGFEGRSS